MAEVAGTGGFYTAARCGASQDHFCAGLFRQCSTTRAAADPLPAPGHSSTVPTDFNCPKRKRRLGASAALRRYLGAMAGCGDASLMRAPYAAVLFGLPPSRLSLWLAAFIDPVNLRVPSLFVFTAVVCTRLAEPGAVTPEVGFVATLGIAFAVGSVAGFEHVPDRRATAVWRRRLYCSLCLTTAQEFWNQLGRRFSLCCSEFSDFSARHLPRRPAMDGGRR